MAYTASDGFSKFKLIIFTSNTKFNLGYYKPTTCIEKEKANMEI
jgi:hypothetical protein